MTIPEIPEQLGIEDNSIRGSHLPVSNNVVPFPPAAAAVVPARIALARIQQGARLLTNAGVNDTYHGEVQLASGDVRLAYIKDLDAVELANELLVGYLGATLNWPMPKAYLGVSDAGQLPLTKAPTNSGGHRLVFVSEDAQTPSLRHYYETGDLIVLSVLAAKLAEWARVGSIYGVDTWCANVDRNLGNILVGANDAWMIDHGRCFSGPAWSTADLVPDHAYDNLIAGWLTPFISPAARGGAASIANDVAMVPDSVLDQAATLSFASDLLGAAEASAVVQFLKDRRPHVGGLAANALGLVI